MFNTFSQAKHALQTKKGAKSKVLVVGSAVALATTNASAITIDTTKILSDITSVQDSALLVVIAIAIAVIGIAMVKKLIK